jgi:hypothetical protein
MFLWYLGLADDNDSNDGNDCGKRFEKNSRLKSFVSAVWD